MLRGWEEVWSIDSGKNNQNRITYKKANRAISLYSRDEAISIPVQG